MASYMLTPEESLPQNKQEIINYTEDDRRRIIYFVY
jgi:hypothetical protein